jgi:hypothetical protein
MMDSKNVEAGKFGGAVERLAAPAIGAGRERYITPHQAAAELKICVRKIREYIRTGYLPAVNTNPDRTNGRYRIPVSGLQVLMDNLAVCPPHQGDLKLASAMGGVRGARSGVPAGAMAHSLAGLTQSMIAAKRARLANQAAKHGKK